MNILKAYLLEIEIPTDEERKKSLDKVNADMKEEMKKLRKKMLIAAAPAAFIGAGLGAKKLYDMRKKKRTFVGKIKSKVKKLMR